MFDPGFHPCKGRQPPISFSRKVLQASTRIQSDTPPKIQLRASILGHVADESHYRFLCELRVHGSIVQMNLQYKSPSFTPVRRATFLSWGIALGNGTRTWFKYQLAAGAAKPTFDN
jgi:hypothetical protein